MWKNAAFTVECLRTLAARIDAAITPGHETDMVILRATKLEAAMLRVIIDDALG